MTAVHIRIPDLDLYGPLLLWLLGGCAPALASRVHELWSKQRSVEYHQVYAAVLCVVLALGATFLGSPLLGAPSLVNLGVALLCAMPLAWMSFEANLALTRYYRRVIAQRAPTRKPPQAAEGFTSQVRPFKPGARNTERRVVKPAVPQQPSSSILVVVAILEECVFRGLLLDSALHAQRWHVALLVVLSIALFCLGHVHYGAVEAIGKLPLALLVTVPTMLTGSCLLACLVHVGFNLKVARANRALIEQAAVIPIGART